MSLKAKLLNDLGSVVAMDTRHYRNMLEMLTGPLKAIELFAVSAEVRAARTKSRSSGSVAVIPVRGVLTHRESFWSMFFGDSTCEGCSAMLDEALAASGVSTILMEFDSPGGSVYGIEELGRKIRQARQTKRIVAVANPMAASAAWWLFAQADERYITPSGEVGSQGVYSLHQDVSGMLDELGVKMTFVSAGKFKTENNPYEPMTEEGMAAEQEAVNAYYDTFLSEVAKGIGVPKDTARKEFGEGRMVLAKDAVARGMADGIKTFDEVARSVTSRRNAAQLENDRWAHEQWELGIRK